MRLCLGVSGARSVPDGPGGPAKVRLRSREEKTREERRRHVKRISRLLVLLASLTVLVVASTPNANAATEESELEPELFAACMNGVNTYYNACINSGGDPLDCEMNRLAAKIECWSDYCLIMPTP